MCCLYIQKMRQASAQQEIIWVMWLSLHAWDLARQLPFSTGACSVACALLVTGTY